MSQQSKEYDKEYAVEFDGLEIYGMRVDDVTISKDWIIFGANFRYDGESRIRAEHYHDELPPQATSTAELNDTDIYVEIKFPVRRFFVDGLSYRPISEETMKQPPSQQSIAHLMEVVYRLGVNHGLGRKLYEEKEISNLPEAQSALLELILSCYDKDGEKFIKNIKEKFNAK